MKIAIPLTQGHLSDHFGHCDQFAMVEADLDTKQICSQTLVEPPPHEPGMLPRWLHEQGVAVVITGGIGRRALDLFTRNGIAIHGGTAGVTPESVAQAFLIGTLGDEVPACHHHPH